MASYVPGTATTISGMDVASIRKTAWDSKLRTDSVRPSIFSELKSEYVAQINDMSDLVITKPGLLLDISNVGKSQMGQSVKVTMRLPLRKRPRYGDGEDILGNEDESTLLQSTLYYNEIKKGAKYNQWGYAFNDTEYLNFNGGYNDALALFMAEVDDDRIQQALLMRYGDELTYSPVSLTQSFNRNWAIPNLTDSAQPDWTTATTLATTAGAVDTDLYYPDLYYADTAAGLGMAEQIGDALETAAGAAATPTAVLTVDHWVSLHNYLEFNHMVEPIMIDGIWSKVFTIATPTKHFALNPSKSGSLGAYWQNVADYKDPKMKLPGEIGRFMDDWVVIHNDRAPTLSLQGANGARQLKPGYLHPGNNDDRNLSAWSATSGSTNYGFDICMLLGANALAIYRRDEMVTGMSETTEYGKRKGVAVYKGEGLQLPFFDRDTAAAAYTTYRGSCVIPVSRASVDTII